MELYVFDKTRQLVGLVESYEYLRWTRRYSACGDFELRAIASHENIEVLKMGHLVFKSDDDEAGIIEYLEMTSDENEYLLVRGRFASGLLARRIIWGTEILKGDISAAVGQIVTRHAINPDIAERALPGLHYTASNLESAVDMQVSYKNVLETIERLCEAADIGFKTLWNWKTRLFTFTLYRGAESAALFSKEYENLNAQTYVESALNSCNVALVGGEGEGAARIMQTVGDIGGEERAEMFVDAKSLRKDDYGAGYNVALSQHGAEKLAGKAATATFDAAINPHGNMLYKRDFDLGQTVRVVAAKWGVLLTARISEIEESYDRDGTTLQVVFGRGLLTLGQKLGGSV